jgi:hypothetical protein
MKVLHGAAQCDCCGKWIFRAIFDGIPPIMVECADEAAARAKAARFAGILEELDMARSAPEASPIVARLFAELEMTAMLIALAGHAASASPFAGMKPRFG